MVGWFGFVWFATAGQELSIDGVEFKVVACHPHNGIVSYRTIIYAAGDALRAGMQLRTVSGFLSQLIPTELEITS